MSKVSSISGHNEIPPVVKEIIYDEQTISKRVAELAQEITRDYRGKELVMVGILKGAFLFLCDLSRQLPFPVCLDFLAISHYGQENTTGEVRIIKDLEEDVSQKHLLLIEDIVDTGLSLNYLVRVLLKRDPASLAVCTLLDRTDLRLADVPLKYVGFNVSHEFLIGYGLDYRDRYRDLPFIASMQFTSEVEEI